VSHSIINRRSLKFFKKDSSPVKLCKLTTVSRTRKFLYSPTKLLSDNQTPQEKQQSPNIFKEIDEISYESSSDSSLQSDLHQMEESPRDVPATELVDQIPVIAFRNLKPAREDDEDANVPDEDLLPR